MTLAFKADTFPAFSPACRCLLCPHTLARGNMLYPCARALTELNPCSASWGIHVPILARNVRSLHSDTRLVFDQISGHRGPAKLYKNLTVTLRIVLRIILQYIIKRIIYTTFNCHTTYCSILSKESFIVIMKRNHSYRHSLTLTEYQAMCSLINSRDAHNPPINPCDIIPILEMKKLKLREIK